jgi:hypothetical protein
MLRYGNIIPDSVREFIITSEPSARREKYVRRNAAVERQREREEKKREEKKSKKKKRKCPTDGADSAGTVFAGIAKRITIIAARYRAQFSHGICKREKHFAERCGVRGG